MFLRTVRSTGANGQSHEYLRLVESFWEDGRCKQRVVANLGRKDLLAPHADSLLRLLQPHPSTDATRVPLNQVRPLQGFVWGPMLVARSVWEELGLQTIFDALPSKLRRRQWGSFSDRALVLVANRLCEPHSEHGLSQWLETDFVCDRHGRRYDPVWKTRKRVRVDLTWLQRWYRTLDELYDHKRRIEKEIFASLRDLFSLHVDVVLYDITSTYFEGCGGALAEYGYSRDGRPQNRQVLVGLVRVGGWPIAHHVFRGNRLDQNTVVEVLEDLQERFGLSRVVFVGDRGMVSSSNLGWIREHGQGYLVGLRRRRNPRVLRYLARATGPWQECPLSINQQEASAPSHTLVQEVASDEATSRVFVIHSEQRANYERAMRERETAKSREALEALSKRVTTGKLKDKAKIGVAASRILSRNHGHRYFGWKSEQDGSFEYFERAAEIEQEKAMEGKYVIQTEEVGMTAVQAVQTYKQLTEVESSFRNLKDVIDLRPIYHRTDHRIEAHIFVATLALLVKEAIDKRLDAAHVPLSAQQALEALRTVQVVDIQAGDFRKAGVTNGSARARQALAALGIKKLDPPNLVSETRPGRPDDNSDN